MIGSRTPDRGSSGTPDRGRRSGRWLAVTATCAALALVAGGCAGGRQAGTADVGRSAAPAGVSCSAADPTAASPAPSAPPSPEPLAADFVPVTASRCTVAIKPVAGDGEWQMYSEQQAIGPFDALVGALRAPSERHDGQICPAIGMVPIVITLTDAHGRTATPAIPHNACGLPTQAVLQAIGALPWKTVKETRVRQVRSPLELESGCPGQYKPVIAMQAAVGSGAAGTDPLLPGTPPTSLVVCRYALDPASTVELAGSGTFAGGRLVTATTLTGPTVARLVAGLNTAPPVTGHCDRPEAPFAVLPGSWVAVETGGCNRAMGTGGGLRQVDAATVAILTG